MSEPFRILWWSASVIEAQAKPSHREALADFLDAYGGGDKFDVTFWFSRSRGEFEKHMQNARYDLIIVDATNRNSGFNSADLDAFRQFYATSGKALMLDGSLWIRNTNYDPLSVFPGKNRSSAGLLVNQVEALRKAGGGLLIGTDHNIFQRSANQVLGAILPDAKFSGLTNPSSDGDFLGEVLLAGLESVRPIDILAHWGSVPNQGQAPVGDFRDFLGTQVRLYSLVETSDKPGGKRKRPYISFTVDPGDRRFAIDGDVAPEIVIDNMPTRKGPPAN